MGAARCAKPLCSADSGMWWACLEFYACPAHSQILAKTPCNKNPTLVSSRSDQTGRKPSVGFFRRGILATINGTDNPWLPPFCNSGWNRQSVACSPPVSLWELMRSGVMNEWSSMVSLFSFQMSATVTDGAAISLLDGGSFQGLRDSIHDTV